MDAVFSSPLFGIVLCIFTFEIGVWLNRKTHSPLANPLLIAVALCIAFLQIFSIPLADFNEGGRMISMFLAPATAALALSIYGQKEPSADCRRNAGRFPDLHHQRVGIVQIVWTQR